MIWRWQQGHGFEVIASTPEEMTAHLKKEIAIATHMVQAGRVRGLATTACRGPERPQGHGRARLHHRCRIRAGR